MAKLTQSHRIAAVGTSLPADHLLLKSFRGREEVSQPFRFVVEMLSEDSDIPLNTLMGESLTVRLAQENEGGPRFFNGIVADLRQLEPLSGLHRYEAVVVPWLWFMGLAVDCRVFQKETVPEILAKVFKAHGFADFEERLSEKYEPLEFCVQYGETDLSFVNRLMEEVGIHYYFTHTNGKHTLILADSRAAHDAFPEYPRLRYRGPGSSTHGPDDVLLWESRMQAKPGGVILRDYNFAEPAKLLQPDASDEKDHNLAAFTHYDYNGDFSQDGGSGPAGKRQLDNPATIRLRSLQADFQSVYAETQCRGIHVGHTFSLHGCFRKDQNKSFFVTSVEHKLILDDYVSGTTGAEPVYSARFTAIPAAVDYAPPRVTPRPSIKGPQTAVVVGRKGEEIHTDEFGRVKIQFHWDRDGKKDENSSCWVRVAQNWAGKKWGAFFLPRIGQEVIVEFLEGDPDRPIVTGCVYNGSNQTPYDLPAEKTKSTLKSNSSKDKQGHNEVRFEDKAGKEQIYMHAERDMDIRIKRNLRQTNFGDCDVQVGSSEFGEESGDLRITVHNDENHHVGNDLYRMVDNDEHHVVKGELAQKFEQSQKTYVGEDAVLNAKRQIVETSTSISQKTGKYLVQGSDGVHIKGKAIHLEAANISLKCGGNFISMGPAGVSIKGSMVRINSGGSAQGAEKTEILPEISVFEPVDALLATDSTAGDNADGIVGSLVRVGGTVLPRLAPELELVEVVAGQLPGGLGFAAVGAIPIQSSAGLTDAVDPQPGTCRRTYLLRDDKMRSDLNSGRLAVLSPNKKGQPDILKVEDLGKGPCGCAGAQFGLASNGLRLPISQPLKVPMSNLISIQASGQNRSLWDFLASLASLKPLEDQVCIWCPLTGEEIKRTQLLIYDGAASHQFELDTFKIFAVGSPFHKLSQLIEKIDALSGGLIIKSQSAEEVLRKGLHLPLGLLHVEFKPPSIKLKFEGGWCERTQSKPKENEVYYGMTFSLAADPLVAVSCKVDLIFAILCIPPLAPAQGPYLKVKNALQKSQKKKGIQFDGPPLYLEFSLKLAGAGTLTRAESWQGGVELSLVGRVAIGAEILLGVVSFEGNIGGSVSGDLKIAGKASDMALVYDLIKWKGLEGKFKVAVDTGWFGKWGKERKVLFSEPMARGLVYGEVKIL